jgi:hypothetical protein
MMEDYNLPVRLRNDASMAGAPKIGIRVRHWRIDPGSGGAPFMKRCRTMTRYWVVGGEYQDTRFDQPRAGTALRRFGPYDRHEDAKAKWQELAWGTVDNAHERYRIEAEKDQTPQSFWVVGCSYRDTNFDEPVSGKENWYGPFASYEEAKAEWQKHAWATVDDAMSRFRIEILNGSERPPSA